MSYTLAGIFGQRQPKSINIRPAAANTYDGLVASFGDYVTSYWKLQVPSGSTVIDEKGIQNGTLNGNPERNVETIVDLDTVAEGAPADGKCIAFTGTPGEYMLVPSNTAYNTDQGTIAITFQRDTTSEKVILLDADDLGIGSPSVRQAGNLGMEVNADGSIRGFFRGTDLAAVVLTGAAGDVQIRRAYTMFLKWGSAGFALSLWNDQGVLVRRLTNALATGRVGNTSPLRFGMYLTDTGHFDGPIARIVLMNRRLGDSEETTLARARTIDHGGAASLDLGTLAVFSRSTVQVTALAGWPVGRTPKEIVSQGAHCSAYVRRAWKPTNNNGQYVDFVTGWQKTLVQETIILKLDDNSEIGLLYTVGHTIPSPGSGGVTRTLDKTATPSGTTYNTWSAAVAALNTNDVLVVRAPTGTWTDSGGHAIPNYVYDVTTNVAPGAGISNVTVVAHPDDVAIGQRPVLWRNAGRYARFKYAASAAWQVHADLGSGRVIYESVATSTQPSYSYFGAYRSVAGDWIALYPFQAITDATDRSGVLHDTSYTPANGTAVTNFRGPGIVYNKTTNRWEVRLNPPVKQAYMDPATSCPYPPWDWTQQYAPNNDARTCEIVITDGSNFAGRNMLLNLDGRGGWKFYNIDFVYGNAGVQSINVTTQPQFYGCTFLGGAPTAFENSGSDVDLQSTSSAVLTYGTGTTPTTDLIIDRCTLEGSMPPWSSFGEGKGFEGAGGIGVRREFTSSNRARFVIYSSMLRNWWHFTWMSNGQVPIKCHFHHSQMQQFGQDGALIQDPSGDLNVNRCFMPSACVYGFGGHAGTTRYSSFNVDLRLSTIMCGAPGATKWAETEGPGPGNGVSVSCLVHPQLVAHAGSYEGSDRSYHNTCVGSQNTFSMESFDATEGCGSGMGTDTRGTNNRIFNCIGAVYPPPFAWPVGKSALVVMYTNEGGNSQYNYNVLFKSAGMLTPGAGSNTFARVNSGSGSGTAYASLSALQSGTGFDLNSVQADPQFVVAPVWASTNPYASTGLYAMGNYLLAAGSPARTAGRNINDQALPDYDFQTLTTWAGGANAPWRGALQPDVPAIEQEVGIVGPLPPTIV